MVVKKYKIEKCPSRCKHVIKENIKKAMSYKKMQYNWRFLKQNLSVPSMNKHWVMQLSKNGDSAKNRKQIIKYFVIRRRT